MSADMNTGLLLHYKLDKIFDGKILDLSEYAFHGEAKGNNIQAGTSPLTGWMMTFLGEGNYISVPSLDLAGAKELTLMLWYKAGSSNEKDQTVLAFSNKNIIAETVETHFSLGSSIDGQILFSAKTADGIDGLLINENPNGKFKHLAIVISETGVKAFLNGDLAAENTTVHTLGSYNDIRLGNWASDLPMDCAQFRLFKRALTEEDIQEIYQSDLNAGSQFVMPELLAHLPLDEIRDGGIADVSGFGLQTALAGTMDLVYDEEMGSSVSFDGIANFIALPPIKWNKGDSFTFEAWINIASDPSDCTLFSFASTEGSFDIGLGFGGGNLQLSWSNETHLYSDYMPTNKWTHLACVVNQEGALTVLVNASPVYRESTNSLGIVFGEGEINVKLGSDKDGKNLFKGQINQFRLYRKTLSDMEVRLDMLKDQGSNATFRSLNPIDFKLHTLVGEETVPVLFIESVDNGASLELIAINNTDMDVLFGELPSLDIDRYHFQVRFRPNVLSKKTFDSLMNAPDKKLGEEWQYACGFDEMERENWISFQKTSATTLKKGLSARVLLPNISAAAEGGARNTRAGIKFANLVYSDALGLPISGSLMRHLEIVSGQSQPLPSAVSKQPFLVKAKLPLGDDKFIPTVPFLPFAIFSDGVFENRLDLFIYPLDPDKGWPLSHEEARPSEFLFSFKDKESYPKERFLFQCSDTRFQSSGTSSGKRIFGITCLDQNANAYKFIQIKISEWITERPSGIFCLNIEYRNIPGFEDGVMPVFLQTSKVLLEKRSISIGGNYMSGLRFESGNPDGTSKDIGLTMRWKDDEIGKYAMLNVDNKELQLKVLAPNEKEPTNIRLISGTNGTVFIGKPGKTGRLQVEGEGLKLVSTWKDNPQIGFSWSWEGKKNYGNITLGNNGLNISSNKDVAICGENGNVGIGTSSPTSKLDIRGDLKCSNLLPQDNDKQLTVSSDLKATGRVKDKTGFLAPVGSMMAFAGKKAPEGWLLCDGAAVSIDQYKDLFEVIETTYNEGNCPPDKFRLPDLRSRFIAGAGNGNGLSNYGLGSKGGQEMVQLTNGQMPRHRHSINGSNFWRHYRSFSGLKGDDHPFKDNGNGNDGDHYSWGTDEEGGNEAHENRPPFIAMNYIIKY